MKYPGNKSDKEQEQQERLMKTIDRLNHHYGNGTISWASCGLNKSSKIHREFLSHAATTRIEEIPIVKA